MSTFDVGQLILMGIPGTELNPDTASLIKSIQPGGFIIFGRNIQSPEQLRKLTDDLRSISKTEPFITIDQEGGRVSRLRLIGSEPPNAIQLSRKNNIKLIKKHGKLTGELLRLYGFNLNLCPVLDISLDEKADNSLRGRCYGEDVDQVITNAASFNKAMKFSKKTAMTLSDKFCVDRHKKSFLNLVNNKLDITFANEQEVLSLINAKNFDEVISFGKQLKKLIVITRSDKGSIAIQKNEVTECDSQKNLKIVDLTGAGDLFAAGFLHGHVNNLSIKESLQKGTEMASKIIQKIGARLN